MRILLDLDEVLADFVGGACALWGAPIQAVRDQWVPGTWGLVEPLSAVLTTRGRKSPLSGEEFWRRLDGNVDFWAELEHLPWMDDVLTLVKEYTEDWHIVTSPSWCDSSITGKVRWVKRHLGKKFTRILPTPHKYVCAMPGVVLVDDRESNVADFTVWKGKPTGADGILFPRLHNRNHPLEADPAKYLRAALAQLEK